MRSGLDIGRLAWPRLRVRVVVLCFAALFGTGASAQEARRNILFIAVDDLRNWVNYAGDYAGRVHTPNIDALAARSTRYLNAYASVPQCAGSRTSVLLGQSPANHGIDWLAMRSGRYEALFADPLTITLPEVMRGRGYHTAVTGKVFHSPQPARWQSNGPATVITEFSNPYDPGPDGTFIIAEVLPEAEQHPDQRVADWASAFVAGYAEPAPFFLAVGFFQPHLPWRVPQWAFDLYPPHAVVPVQPEALDLEDEPPQAVALARKPMLRQLPQFDVVRAANKTVDYTRAYLAAISHSDAMLGQVLDALAASPHAENTDILFWSDHGFHLGDKFHWHKSTFWEAAVRVPLLVYSRNNPDYPVADVREPVSLLDLAPTVLHLAGLAPFAGFAGAPLHDAGRRSRVEVFLDGGRAVVTDGSKRIDYDWRREHGVQDIAAYDLRADPAERINGIVPLALAALREQARQPLMN